MTFLFVFAHPDDETVACAGTIWQLVNLGHKKDGHITNEQVWGELTTKIVDLINHHQPEVLVTFDHSGWYYHLDHVGTSIATTLAFHQTISPQLLFLSNFQPQQNRWNYAFPDTTQSTHRVVVTGIEHKMNEDVLKKIGSIFQVIPKKPLELGHTHVLNENT